jgi:hypothetical protein
MQDQQDIQNVKTWQAPQLIDLGEISGSTEHSNPGPGVDGSTAFAHS